MLAEDWAFDTHARTMTAKGIGDKEQWFSKATLKGARQVTGDDTTGADVLGADSVEFGAMTGDLQRTETGWAFTGLTLASVTLEGIEYVAGDTSVRSTGPTTLRGIAVDLNVSEDDANTVLDISGLRIDTISAQRLTYEDASVKVTVISGELEGILVEHLTFTKPKDAGQASTLEGGVDVKRVKSLALDAVKGKTTARVDVKSDEAALAAPEAKAIKVAFGKAGLEKVDLLGLSGTATIGEKGTTNRILVEWKHLSAAVSHTKTEDGKGDVWSIDRLAVGSVTFKKGSHWEADNAILDIDGQATVNSLFVNAYVELRPDAEGETKVTKAFVHGLTADQIDATGIRVVLKAQPAKEEKAPKDCDGKARAAKKTEPSKQKTFELPHGTINGLKMTGFDLQNRTGRIEVLKDVDIQRLKLTIGDETKEAVQKGVISFKAHGKGSTHPGHGGRELSAELRKDGQRIQIGTVEKISGSEFEGPLTATAFATGKVTTGPIDITPCKVVVPDINVSRIAATKVEYRDGSDLKIGVADATVTGIRIPYLEAQFGDVPDGKGGVKDGLKSLKLGAAGAGGADMMTVDKIEGTDFVYSGTSREPGQPVKTTEVRARKATLTALKVANIERDFVSKFTKVNGELTSASLTGFSLLLQETLDSDTKSKTFFADVNASGIRSNVSLTDAAANGKLWVNGESTFEVDALALTKLRYYQRGPDGMVEVEGRNHLDEASADLKGFKARLHPDGTAFMKFDELTGQKLKLKMDGVQAAVDLVKIEEFVLGLRNMTLEEAKREIALRMKTLSVDGVQANVRIQRKAGTAGTPGQKWTLDPLVGMNGDLMIVYPTAIADLDATLPIRNGVVDFDDATSFAYSYPFGADRRGIYVDLPPIAGGRTHVYEPPGNAGITPETFKKKDHPSDPDVIDSRGAANLKDMLEAALSAPGTGAAPANLAQLNDVGLNSVGPIRISAGKVGTATDFVELEASSTGVNEFVVNAARIGTALQINSPMFRARRSEFNIKGRTAKTGEIEATTMVISINALGSASTGTDAAGHPLFEFDVTLRAEKGVVKDVTWGDIKMFKPDFSGLTSEPVDSRPAEWPEAKEECCARQAVLSRCLCRRAPERCPHDRGRSTSMAAFVGWARKGPTDRATLCLSFSDFDRLFGGLDPRTYLGYAVSHFFGNGGSQAYVIRLTGAAAKTAEAVIDGLKVIATGPGTWAHAYEVSDRRASITRRASASMSSRRRQAVIESFTNLSLDAADTRYVGAVLGAESQIVTAKAVDATKPVTKKVVALAAGVDDEPLEPGDAAFGTALMGDNATTGVFLLKRVDLFNMLNIPGYSNAANLGTLQAFCRDERAMLLVDSTEGTVFNGMKAGPDSSLTGDDGDQRRVLLPLDHRARSACRKAASAPFPPCGFVAGVLRAHRRDARRVEGAGRHRGQPRRRRRRDRGADRRENGMLNPLGVNCLRTFPVFGTVVWGARTLRGADELGSRVEVRPGAPHGALHRGEPLPRH